MTEEDLAQCIADNVARYRTMQNLTQEGLAAITFYSKNTIVNVERGKRLPALSTVLQIANVMDVPIAALFLEGKNG